MIIFSLFLRRKPVIECHQVSRLFIVESVLGVGLAYNKPLIEFLYASSHIVVEGSHKSVILFLCLSPPECLAHPVLVCCTGSQGQASPSSAL